MVSARGEAGGQRADAATRADRCGRLGGPCLRTTGAFARLRARAGHGTRSRRFRTRSSVQLELVPPSALDMTIPSPQFDTFRQCVRDETEKMQLGGYGFDRLAGVLSHTLRSKLPHSELLQVPTEEPVVLFLDHGRGAASSRRRSSRSHRRRAARAAVPHAFDGARLRLSDGLSSRALLPLGVAAAARPCPRRCRRWPTRQPLAVVQRGFFSARDPSPPPQDYLAARRWAARLVGADREDGSTPFAVPSERRTSLLRRPPPPTAAAAPGARGATAARSHGSRRRRRRTPRPRRVPRAARLHPSMGQGGWLRFGGAASTSTSD